MKKNYIFLVASFFFGICMQHVYAQALSGTYTIDNTGPTSGTNFQSFTDAILALNANGVTIPGATFLVTSGQSFGEKTPVLYATGTPTAKITFIKSGVGTNPRIFPNTAGTLTVTAAAGQGDAIMRIAGGDYIEFNGIDLDTNTAYTTSAQKYEYGYVIFRLSPTNASQYVTIRNSTISLYSGLTYASAVLSLPSDSAWAAVTPTAESGRCQNIKIAANTFVNTYSGVQLRGYNHSTAPYNLYDHFNSVDSNTMTSYGGGSVTCWGAYTIYNDSARVQGNTISSLFTSATMYGVYLDAAVNGSGWVLYNTISTKGSTSYAIYNGLGLGTSNFVDMSYNEITNCNATSSLYAIYISGSVALSHVSNNHIHHNYQTGTGSNAFYNIWSIPAATAVSKVFRNNIHDLYVTSTTNSGSFYPIICNTGLETYVYENTLYNIYHNGTGQIINRSNSDNIYWINNTFSRFYAPNSTSTDAIRALESNGAENAHFWYNTVYLDSTGSATTFGSSALYIVTGGSADVRNNILVNVSTPGPTGGVVSAYRRSGNSLGSYMDISNNNCLYAGIPSGKRAVFYDGTNADSLMEQFKLRVGPLRDNLSFSHLPPFINVSTAPYNLHISATTPTGVESAGTPITGYTNDIDGNTRNATTPDIGSDEGTFIAQDLTGPVIKLDTLLNTASLLNRSVSVVITDASGIKVTGGEKPKLYFKKTSDLNTFNGNSNAVSGWKYVEASNAVSPFTFTIDYTLLATGMAPSDTIQYFIIAKDNSATGSVSLSSGVLSTAATSTLLTSVNFPLVSQVNGYRILSSLAAGTYTVGTGNTYTNLTAVKNALATNVISGNIVFEITASYVSTGETFPISFDNISREGGNWSVIIRPGSGVTGRVTSGDPGSANPLIELNGISGIEFDGRPDGTGTTSEWIFRNTRTAATIGPVFRLINGAQQHSLNYLRIEGSNSTTTSGLVLISTTTGTRGNSNNTISNCTIGNRSDIAAATYANSVFSSGTAAAPNANNKIMNCKMYNFATNAIGVSATGNGSGWLISGNHCYRTLPTTVAHVTINFIPGVPSAGNIIRNNYVGGSLPFTAGSASVQNVTTTAYTGIVVNADTTTVDSNVIKNIYSNGTTGTFALMNINSTSRNITVAYNVLGDTTGVDTTGTNKTSTIHGILSACTGKISIIGNTVSSLRSYSTSATTPSMRGIDHNGAGSVAVISRNRVFNIRTTSANITFAVDGGFALNGIRSGVTAQLTMTDNKVYDLEASNTTATAVTVAAMLSSGSSQATISRNMVYNIRNKCTGSENRVYGIAVFDAPGENIVSNNYVSLGDATPTSLFGIVHNNAVAQPGPIRIYYNTVFVSGVAASAAYRSYGFMTLFNTPIELKNNILYNERTGGTGLHYAIAHSAATPTNWTSDYNLLYSTDTTTALGLYGNVAPVNYGFTPWRMAMGSDQHSVSFLVNFVAPSTSAPDLHLTGGSAGNHAMAGRAVAGITTDFDGDTRNTYPYMGADEVTGSPLPVKLVTFDATRIKEDVAVSWTTAAEINASHFVVEVSADGELFETVSKVRAVGTADNGSRYQLMHDDVQRKMNGASVVYYRLMSVDQDGTSATSDLVSVKFDDSDMMDAVKTFPNPFNTELTIQIPSAEKTSATIEVLDIRGRKVASTAKSLVEGMNEVRVSEVATLETGIYFVKTTVNGESKVVKVMKN